MFQYRDYIYTIYKEASFSKAASKLFISQPALSSVVKKVEKKLGIKIFDRSSFPIAPTTEGRLYIEAIEKSYALENEYLNKLTDIDNLDIGSITVSGANFISSFVISKIIHVFLNKYPKINVNLIESNSVDLETKIFDDTADLILDYNKGSAGITSLPLLSETIMLAVPQSAVTTKELKDKAICVEDICNNKHHAKNCPAIDLNVFAESTFVLVKPGNNMNHHSKSLCNEFGFEPKCSIYSDQLMTSYNMALMGMGIAFVSDTLIKSVSPTKDLYFYKIKSKNITRTLYILYKSNKELSKASEKFIETAMKMYKE